MKSAWHLLQSPNIFTQHVAPITENTLGDGAVSGAEFKIEYQLIPPVTLSSSKGMKKYLESEALAWSGFLEKVREDGRLDNIPTRRNSSTSGNSLAGAFTGILKKIDDPREFNRATQRYHGGIYLPPPSTSIEGQLILGLHQNERQSDAIAVYMWFVGKSIDINVAPNQPIGQLLARGYELSAGAYASAALPFRRVSSQRLAGAARSAEAQVAALNEEVEKSQEINADHASALAEQLAENARELADYQKSLKRQSKRAKALFLGRERQRRERYAAWGEKVEADVAERFLATELRVKKLDGIVAAKQAEHQKEFDSLKELFHAHLRLRAPASLWGGRSTAHRTRSKNALAVFWGFTALTIAAGALIPFYFGDYIAASFFTQVCDDAEPAVCTRAFSAKGPLTVGGILTIMSLLLWAIRLQYRVYLSERHLALDASEKQAFAETYLAMKEGADVGSDNEAIVLASLFRPTQDGIIKDDDSTLDLSAAALIAKQLGRVPG